MVSGFFSSVFDLSCLFCWVLGFRWTLTSKSVRAKDHASKPLTMCLITRPSDQCGTKLPHSTWPPQNNKKHLPWTKNSNCNLWFNLMILSRTENYLSSTQNSSQRWRTSSRIRWWWMSFNSIRGIRMENGKHKRNTCGTFIMAWILLFHFEEKLKSYIKVVELSRNTQIFSLYVFNTLCIKMWIVIQYKYEIKWDLL